MEKSTKLISFTLENKERVTQAVRIEDSAEKAGFYWMVTSAELLRLLIDCGFDVSISDVKCDSTIVMVELQSENKSIGKVFGSCRVNEGLDPVGIAMRRAVNNFAYMTGLFDDLWNKVRELNDGRTLDPMKSDPLNDSVTKHL